MPRPEVALPDSEQIAYKAVTGSYGESAGSGSKQHER